VATTSKLRPVAVPIPPTPLLGRDRELADVLAFLRAADGAPVTVTGPGGIGKTRVAVEAAAQLDGELSDGVSFVSLAEIRDPWLVAEEVGRALRLAPDRGGDPTDGVIAALQHRHMLLVLDNFEQVAEAAPFVVALTARCAKLAVLVTSRRQLGIVGEQVIELGPLEIPAASRADEPASGDSSVTGVASVALFCERAAALDSRFAPDPNMLVAIGEICRRLDGLPLAIELIAAFTRQHAPTELLAGLDDVAASDAFEQLSSAIRFSYDLLDEESRQLLRRVSVFDGGWSLDALDAVCGEDTRPAQRLDALSELIDLHLAEPVAAARGLPRYRLLETIRTFARRELAASGEAEVIARRHADFFADFAVRAERGLESRRARQWSEEIDGELANLRAAMDHLAATGRAADALRTTAALGRYWLTRGPAAEGLRRLDECLRRSPASPEAADAEAWGGRLSFEMFVRERGQTAEDPIARLDRARAALSATGDERAYLRATAHLSHILRFRGDLQAAEQIAEEGLALCTTPSTSWFQAELLNHRSMAARDRDRELAARLADRGIEAARASGNERCLTDVTFTRLLLDLDRDLATMEPFEALYRQTQQVGNTRGQALVAMCLGAMATGEDDAVAGTWYLRAIDIGRETGYDRTIWWAMSGLVIALAESAPSEAARLHGSLLARSGELLPVTSPAHQENYESAAASLHHSLEPAELTRLIEEGRRLPWDEAVDEARKLALHMAADAEPAPGATRRAPRRRRRGPRANPELTDRELEILAELVRGHTNQRIAEELDISPKTVMHHTASVYRKLAVRGRAEAVAHALRSGLVPD
jgi:predicted ATPase/DNA-binding CsgD family transcriptional regulator